MIGKMLFWTVSRAKRENSYMRAVPKTVALTVALVLTMAAFLVTGVLAQGTGQRGTKRAVTALMRAAFAADIEEMKRLVSKNDINAQDSSGWTALVYAAQGDKRSWANTATDSSGVEAMKFLLNSGADPNIRSSMAQTAIMSATAANRLRVQRVKLLIAAGADVNAQDKNGRSALMNMAARLLGGSPPDFAQQLELVSTLVAIGARTDLRDASGRTIFDLSEDEWRRWSGPSQPAEFVQSVRRQYDELLSALRP
jgi:ankyrin repeat protein